MSRLIEPREMQILRATFEDSMRKEPFRFHNFSQTLDGGYQVSMLQMAWHACRCGYLSGRSYVAE